jgi:pimeloyl-ACP methyl ester carboxylesterase
MLEKLADITSPGQEHWIDKDGARLFLWEKRRAPNTCHAGTILFVHGSSWASLPSFDLQVPKRPFSSAMDRFATQGFDCWCFDAEGYGRSDKHRDSQFGIESGVKDIAAVTDYIFPLRKLDNVLLYGTSSGALKAALFTQRFPARVKRLALDAFVWTGKDSPTLEQRRKLVPELLKSKRRAFTREFIRSVFERDHRGTAEEETVEVLAREALRWDTSVPIGTYIDMCTKLPMVNPEEIPVPTVLMRGQYDGVAGVADLYEFFAKLPNPDKQFAHMPGVAHAGFQQKNYELVYHILWSFFTQPAPVYRG